MPKLHCRIATLSIVGGLAAIAPLRAQSLTRLGGEFQINTYTTATQSGPGVAVDGSGDFVVTWVSGHDGSNTGVFAQRFNAMGSAQAAEFQVNTFTTLAQTGAAVATDAAGEFVVVWISNGQDGDGFGLFARRFNAGGSPQAAEFQVNSHTPLVQANVDVGSDAAGAFVVVWTSNLQDGSQYGVFARRFNAAGTPQAAEFRVNTYTQNDQIMPAVALDADGDFVVTWASELQDGDGYGVFARRFDSTGVAQGAEFQVNTYTTDYQYRPDVARESDGDFVVTWTSNLQDGFYNGVFAQRFDSAGARQGAEFQVNSYTEYGEYHSVVALGNRGFVISWTGFDGQQSGLFARSFSVDGEPQATELQINAYTEFNQRIPVLARGGPDFVIAWQSVGQDGSSYGIFAQRLASFAVLDIDGDGETAPLTDGLLVLRFLFGFTGATLVSGAVDVVGCNRCSATEVERYLQTLI